MDTANWGPIILAVGVAGASLIAALTAAVVSIVTLVRQKEIVGSTVAQAIAPVTSKLNEVVGHTNGMLQTMRVLNVGEGRQQQLDAAAAGGSAIGAPIEPIPVAIAPIPTSAIPVLPTPPATITVTAPATPGSPAETITAPAVEVITTPKP